MIFVCVKVIIYAEHDKMTAHLKLTMTIQFMDKEIS